MFHWSKVSPKQIDRIFVGQLHGFVKWGMRGFAKRVDIFGQHTQFSQSTWATCNLVNRNSVKLGSFNKSEIMHSDRLKLVICLTTSYQSALIGTQKYRNTSMKFVNAISL